MTFHAAQPISVGDRVRSFDFQCRSLTGGRAAYAEGTVDAIGDFLGLGFDQYRIKVERQIFGGKELPAEDRDPEVFPPVNGTRSILGGVTDGVVRLCK